VSRHNLSLRKEFSGVRGPGGKKRDHVYGRRKVRKKKRKKEKGGRRKGKKKKKEYLYAGGQSTHAHMGTERKIGL